MEKSELHFVCLEATEKDPPHLIRFRYYDLHKSGVHTTREVAPYSFRELDLGTVLYGYEFDPPSSSASGKPGIKAFYVDLISNAEVVEDATFEPLYELEF